MAGAMCGLRPHRPAKRKAPYPPLGLRGLNTEWSRPENEAESEQSEQDAYEVEGRVPIDFGETEGDDSRPNRNARNAHFAYR
jgi:hypothetical protein